MVSLPVVLLIFFSSSYRNRNFDESALALESNINSGTKHDRALEETARDGVSKMTQENLKAPAYPSDNQRQQLKRSQKEEENEVPGTRAINEANPEGKGGNDHLEFPRDLNVHEGKTMKVSSPMPLYSLVKNVCEEGYVMDQNGVCQKAVVLRTGKEFDSDRKKRFVQDEELMSQWKGKPFFENFNKVFPHRRILEKLKGKKDAVECEKIYPGLVSDGEGGCRKSSPPSLAAIRQIRESRFRSNR